MAFTTRSKTIIIGKTMFLYEFVNTPGVYVGIKLDKQSIESLQSFIKDNEIPNPIDSNDMHVTIMYSEKPIHKSDELIDPKLELTASATEFDLYGDDRNCLVLKIDCDELHKRHQFFTEKGGKHSYDEYSPHITLSYDCPDFDVKSLPKFTGEITLTDEYSEPLTKNWADDK